MTKTEFEAALAAKLGISKMAGHVHVDAFIDVITETLASGQEVSFGTFGRLSVKKTKARAGRNPATGETIQIAAGRRAKFMAGSALKSAIG